MASRPTRKWRARAQRLEQQAEAMAKAWDEYMDVVAALRDFAVAFTSILILVAILVAAESCDSRGHRDAEEGWRRRLDDRLDRIEKRVDDVRWGCP